MRNGNEMKRRPGGIVLAYDASCGPCSKFRAVVSFLDVRSRIAFLDIEDAERAGLLDGVPQAYRYASFHIVTPRGRMAGAVGVVSGQAAILSLVGALSAPVAKVVERISSLEAAIRFGYSTLSRLHRGCPPSKGQARRRGLRDGG
ncbi:MAG TPA: DCC1-like thiol-disulfide oxidoreductase family protein [Nitrososphaerales archaeon]|nr:DCC1-like thiol-disulfide oxidoreductase family protein [Nitrososphaerales archaeon]